MDRFYGYLTGEYPLSPKTMTEDFRRGVLFSFTCT